MEPEDLLHEFITMTGLNISSIRADGAGEFKKSASFMAYCKLKAITVEEVPAYTHTFNARAEGAVRICKEKVRALLRRANMPRRFWPDALMHWCRTYAHWPDAAGHTAWEKLDDLGSHALCHNLARDRHVFGSYVTGHLPREHPHVADTTHDDRAEEGVFLGNDLTGSVHIGPSNACHRAGPETIPLWRLFLIRVIKLSLRGSLSLSGSQSRRGRGGGP